MSITHVVADQSKTRIIQEFLSKIENGEHDGFYGNFPGKYGQ